MRKKVLTVGAVLCALAFIGVSSPATAQGKKITSGTVTGLVQTVGACSPLGGALVYIPGRSFLARLDKSGQFTLDDVPAGTGYTLRVEVPGDTSYPPYHDKAFDVTSSVVTLAPIEVNCDGGTSPLCGNDTTDFAVGEVCDGVDLPGGAGEPQRVCSDFMDGTGLFFDVGKGTLSCSTTCFSFNTSQCQRCGNNLKEGSEPCDGVDLGGASCLSLGFISGTLACSAICAFDTGSCQP